MKMSVPNWITVTVRSPKPVSESYMGNLMRVEQPQQQCAYYPQYQQAAFDLQCHRESSCRYRFSFADAKWSKKVILEFCSMLLQCPEVESVLLGQQENGMAVESVAAPSLTLWQNMRERLHQYRLLHSAR
jgi:hypothetical protein